MTAIALKLEQLVASSHNVRIAPERNEGLKASLLNTGQVQPISVVQNDAGQFEIVAGARRVQAFRDLIDEGLLPPETEIQALVLEAGRGDLTNVSLAENMMRLPMTPADQFVAFKRMADEEGLNAMQIANRFGMTEQLVLQRLALANLHPDVFAAFARGEMTMQMAQYFTVEPNPERQREVFATFLKPVGDDEDWSWFEVLDEAALEALEEDEREEYDNDLAGFTAYQEKIAKGDQSMVFKASDWQVKEAILNAAIRGSDPRAKMIGVEAFVEAGGQVTADLFAENEDSQMFSPADLLNDLVNAKLIAHGQAMVDAGEIGFFLHAPALHVSTYGVEGIWDVYSYEKETKYDALPLENRGITICLNRDGSIDAGNKLITNKRPPNAAGSGSGGASSGPKNALSERACNELAYMRREIIQLELLNQPALAHSYLLFVEATRALHIGHYSRDLGTTITRDFQNSDGVSSEDDAIFRQQGTAAELADWESKLDKSWADGLKGSSPGGAAFYEAFTKFCQLTNEQQQLWGAFAIATSLHSTANVHGVRNNQFHQLLGRDMGIDVRKHFTPNEGNYFAYTSKAQMLALLAGFGETEKKAAKMKTPDLRAFMTSLAKGEGPPEDGAAAKHLLAWVPSELQFAKAEVKTQSTKPKAKRPAKKSQS